MARPLPSEELLREQAKIAQWKREQEQRQQLLNPNPVNKYEEYERRKRQYEQYKTKTSKIESKLGMAAFYPMLSASLGSIPGVGDYFQMLDTPMNLAYIFSKPFRTVKKMKRANYERMMEKELGMPGKISRSLDVVSQLGLYTRAYPKALKYLTGGKIDIGLPTSPTGYLMKGLANLAGIPSPTVAHSALGSLGLSFAGMLPFMALSMGTSIMKAKRMAKIQVQRQSGQQIEKEHSASNSIQSYITRLVAENQIQPTDQLKLQLLQWIESHTSVIPVIYEELDLLKQSKEKGTLQFQKSKDLSKYGDDKSLLTKIENVVNASIIKYDPISQLVNFFTSKQFPKDALEDILGTKDEKEYRKTLEQKTRQFGLNRSQFQLLTMTSSQVLNLSSTYEGKILALQSGIYDVMRLSATELTAIRSQGFGIQENMLYTKQVKESKSVFGKLISAVVSIPKAIASLPGINAIWNLIKLPFEAPQKIFEKVSNAFDKIRKGILGEGLTDIMKRPEEVLKKAGLYKSDQELAYSFLGRSLPSLMEDFRKIELEQLEVQQNIYSIASQLLRQFSGVEHVYEKTQEPLKQSREWSTTLGRYLSEKDYRERRKMEEDLIKHTITKEFESRSIIGKISGLLGGNIEQRYQRTAKIADFVKPEDLLSTKSVLDRSMSAISGRQREGFVKTFDEKFAEAEDYAGSVLNKIEKSFAKLISGIPTIAGTGLMMASGTALAPGAALLLPVLGTLFGAGIYGKKIHKIQEKIHPHTTSETMLKSESFEKTEEQLIEEHKPISVTKKATSQISKQQSVFNIIVKELQEIKPHRKTQSKILASVYNKLKGIYKILLDFKLKTITLLSNIYEILKQSLISQKQQTSTYGSVETAYKKVVGLDYDIPVIGYTYKFPDKKIIKEKKLPKILQSKKTESQIKKHLIESKDITRKQNLYVLYGKQKHAQKSNVVSLSHDRTLRQELQEVRQKQERRDKISDIIREKVIDKKHSQKSNVVSLSHDRTLRQELQEVRQKQERRSWYVFRQSVVEYLKRIYKKIDSLQPLHEDIKRKKKDDTETSSGIFSTIKDIFLGTIPLYITKIFKHVKNIVRKSWDFIKSPKEKLLQFGENIIDKGKRVGGKIIDFVKRPIEKLGDVGKGVLEKGKTIFGKAGEVGESVINVGKNIISKGFEFGGKILGKTAEIGKTIFPKGLEFGANMLGKVGEVGSRILGKVAAPLAIATSAYDAYKGWTEANKAFDLKKGEKATFGMKLASAAGRVLTLGLSDKKAAQFLYSLFGGKKKSEQVIKSGQEDFDEGPGISYQKSDFQMEDNLPDTENLKSQAIENIKLFMKKIVTFPLTLYNSVKDFVQENIEKFKDNISGAFKWIFNLPNKIITGIKDSLKNTFVGKLFGSIFGSTDDELQQSIDTSSNVEHAASGGLFLKESITHIAEQNKPEVVLPLENPKTHNIIQQYFEKFDKKRRNVIKTENEYVNLVKTAKNVIKHTNRVEKTEPTVITVPQPVPQPIVTPTTQQTKVDNINQEPKIENVLDSLIEKHLHEIFRNTVITFEKSFQDYIFGNIEFNVI